MYEVKGYVGSGEKLMKYFTEYIFEEEPRTLFVSNEILPENITCFEYLDSIRQSKRYKETDDTLDGLLEFARLDKNANVGLLSLGERSRLLLTGVMLLRAEDYVLCGLYEGATTEDMKVVDEMLTELSLCGNLHIEYMEKPPTDICDEILYIEDSSN